MGAVKWRSIACTVLVMAVPSAGRTSSGRRLTDSSSLAAGITVSYSAEVEGYRSQEGQDKWVNENVFHDMRRGVFVDLGCYDGETYSNTFFFERRLEWTGVCAEPNPDVYPRIAQQAGRTSGVQTAVSGTRRGTMTMVAAFMRSSLNASAVDYEFMASQGIATHTVEVPVTLPRELLNERLPRSVGATVDYVNIDVEGEELSVLRAWPFDEYCVSVFNIENQPAHGGASTLPALKALLQPRGYVHLVRIGVDEVFQRSPLCRNQTAGVDAVRTGRRTIGKSQRKFNKKRRLNRATES